MAASSVCRVGSVAAWALLRARGSPSLLKLPTTRSAATSVQTLQNIPATQVTTLDNGLRVASEGSSQHTCTVGVWIDVGNCYENENNNGAGYFVEHLVFKGTKKRPGKALEEEIERMGAHLNAYSTQEHTAYYIKALSKDLPKAVKILGDIVQNCSLEDSQIEKERNVILQEMQENDNSLWDVVFDYLHATAYQGTPLAQAVEGPSENAKKLSRQDLAEFIDTYYKAPGMVLAAAGGVENKQLVDLAQKHFGSVPTVYAEDAVPLPSSCQFTGSEIRHRDDDMPLAHVAIAVEGPGWANPDNIVLSVANSIIGHYDCTYGRGVYQSSPLASVSVANKVCQSFQTFNICYSETGLFGIHFVTDKMNIDDMVFFLQGQWMRLCTSAMESEVMRGKNILRNALVSYLDGTTPVCEDIGCSLLTYGCRIPLTEWESRISEIDASIVWEVCSKYLYDQCPAMAAVGPIEQLPDYNHIRSGMFWLRF